MVIGYPVNRLTTGTAQRHLAVTLGKRTARDSLGDIAPHFEMAVRSQVQPRRGNVQEVPLNQHMGPRPHDDIRLPVRRQT